MPIGVLISGETPATNPPRPRWGRVQPEINEQDGNEWEDLDDEGGNALSCWVIRPKMNNIFADLLSSLPEELVTVLAEKQHVRIEWIVSTGHSSPENFWY